MSKLGIYRVWVGSSGMVSLPFEVHSHRGGRNSAWSVRVRSLYLISGILAIARLLMSAMDARMLAL